MVLSVLSDSEAYKLEAQRQQRIAHNRAQLAALGVSNLSEHLFQAKGAKTPRAPRVPQPPVRAEPPRTRLRSGALTRSTMPREDPHEEEVDTDEHELRREMDQHDVHNPGLVEWTTDFAALFNFLPQQ